MNDFHILSICIQNKDRVGAMRILRGKSSVIPSLTNALQNSQNFPAKDVFIHQFSKLFQ